MNTMQGACFFACSNMSRTRDAPTPTNISTKSEPEIEKNGTLASPAMALASSVLPVPGGPTSKDRKSTRLNSSHLVISYAVFCLKKKKEHLILLQQHCYIEY